jgi:hypothetical protein
LSERNRKRRIIVLELSRVFAKVQQDRKKTQRHVERERDLEEEQIDKKGQEELQCLMQTTFVFSLTRMIIYSPFFVQGSIHRISYGV